MNPKIRTVLIGGWMALTTAGVVGLLAERAVSDPAARTFDTVNVQRLNVLEPNGNPRVIIANKTHFPGAYMGGKEYRHFNRNTGGFLFFNDEGDEVGGLIFDNNRAKSGGHMSNFSLDQYKQDETVSLNYSQYGGQPSAGLTVHDRPDWSIEPVLEMSDRAARARTPAERKTIEAEMHTFIKSKPGVPNADRVFVGKANGQSLVMLGDKQGKPRLLLKVDADGVPAIEMMDAAGKVTRRITGQ
jgi:hypothetical protein